MILDGFKNQLLKLAAQSKYYSPPRTGDKIEKAMWKHEGNTSKYYNSSLQKDKRGGQPEAWAGGEPTYGTNTKPKKIKGMPKSG